MAGRTAAWLWGAALAALILFAPGVARSAEVIPPGREAIVLALVQRALDAGEATPDEKLKYDIRIEYDVVRVMLTAPDDVELVVHAQRWVENELAPGVVLKCGSAACSDAQQARWKSSAEALALERDNARDTVWTDVQPTVAPDSPKSQGPPRALWVAVMLFGLGWLVAHSVRCLKEIDWRARRRELLVGASLCLAATLIALALTAALPLHEHNSYVARADCAWSLDCSRDPAGPGWVPGFFKAYGPLLHTFPYGVRNLCRFTLVASLFAALLARQWLIGSLLALGWTPNDARRAGLCALAAMCLNPLWIRVAVAGTPWPYVLVCLFGAGLATAETQRGSRANRLLAGAAATCLLSLAVNSNLV
ncbi:MAG: hypothetical protein KC492_16540, partial [Myxococcales bacterium]|nr:hypothetical protein [Myxococcales bacterium]